ncbi:MAG: protein kinase [Candidatus Brocadiae bacterium]|nr:protein kinase [Candidatus Brocadiia bacterium]
MLDASGKVMVTDFGLARQIQGGTTVTQAGVAIGTPAYLSPEMAKAREADGRSDLYSLGATFFHLLAGRPPFQGRNFSEVLIKQVNEPPPPLATAAPRVDRRFCRIIDRLLRENPAARCASAQALLDDLNALGQLHEGPSQSLSPEQVAHMSASTLTGPAAGRRGAGRRRKLLVWSASAALVVAALGIGSWLVLDLLSQPSVQVSGGLGTATASAEHPLERKARDLLNKARAAAASGDAKKAAAYLGHLNAQCSGTDFYKANRTAIADLRASLERVVPPTAPTTKRPTTRGPAVKVPATDVPPGPAPRDPAEWAKWVAIRDEARKLRDAGKLDEAAKRVTEAHNLKIDGIDGLMATEEEAIGAAREKIEAEQRQAIEKAIAAYEKESDKVWDLFKQRKYDDAAKLLAELAAKPEHKPAAKHLAADREAAKLLKEFWAAVAGGLGTMEGRTLVVGKASGTVTEVKGGTVHLKRGRTEFRPSVTELSAGLALRFAGLKQDAHSSLIRGVFLLAEGQDPKTATKALASAPDAPAVAIYRERLAASAFAGARELLAKTQFTEAAKAIADIETDYGSTPWFAAQRDAVAAARSRAERGVADSEALKLYANAAKLYEQNDLRALKPIIEKIKTDYPKTSLVTDATRKPTFAEMAAAIANIGKFITVRKDGKGDFTTIQAAIDACPPNSVVEVQDSATYAEFVRIPPERSGLTLRGAPGCWPMLRAKGGEPVSRALLYIPAKRTVVERIIIANSAPHATGNADHAAFALVAHGTVRMRSAIVSSAKGLAIGAWGWGSPKMDFDRCVIIGSAQIHAPLRVSAKNSMWFGPIGGWSQDRRITTLAMRNVVLTRGVGARLSGEFRHCTILKNLRLWEQPGVVSDCIVLSVAADHRDTQIDYSDVYGDSPFAISAKAGKGCFSKDPQFRDPKRRDYRLEPTSPCRKRASDGGDIGCRYTPEMLKMLALALKLREKGIVKF